MHIGRLGGKHYTNYRELCERNGIKPNDRCCPTKTVTAPGSIQSSLDPFLVPIQPTWSQEGLLSHICQLIVSDDQVGNFISI
jgi:hypothetical protein